MVEKVAAGDKFENEEDRHLARVLSTLIWASWGVFLFIIFTAVVENDKRLIVVLLLGCAGLILPMVLLRRKFLRLSSLILMLFMLGTVTLIATIGQGIRDLSLVSFPIIFIFAGLVLERKFFRLCIGLALVAVGWLVLGEIYGWFTPVPFKISVISNWFYLIGVALILLVGALAVDLLAANMRRNLERARAEVAQRKQTEDALRVSESRLHLATSVGNIGVWDWNVVKDELIWEDSMYSLYGIRKDDFDGAYDAWSRTLHPDDRQYTEGEIQAALRGEREYSPEFRIVHPDGIIRIIKANSQTIRDQDGKALRMIGTNIDITERKQEEQRLNKYSELLEETVAERTRDLREAQEKLMRQEKLSVLGQMAGSVGHELRNPLAAINSAVYYLKLVQPDVSQKIKQYHAMIERELHTAEKIITDLLDFARIKPVDREQVSVAGLIHLTLERCPIPAGVELSLNIPSDLPQVFVDSRQMEQVLGNLTTNACQAMNGTGKLTISARQSLPTDIVPEGDQQVFITVQDTGTGITPENMQKLFEPLFTTKHGGIGLGLVVSKKLIEANDGQILVQSEPGKSTSFTLVLPVNGEK